MSDVVQLIRAANPVPDEAVALPDDEFDALLLLTQIRSGNMDTQQLQTPVEPRKKNRGWLTAAAAFAAVVVAGFVIALVASAGDGSEQDVVDTPPTTQALSQITVVEALAVKDAYIAASNAGGTDAVLALFEPEAEVVLSSLANDIDSFERYLVWSIAQGTTITASDCTSQQLENAVYLRCESTRNHYVAAAVGAPAPEGVLTLLISADGIFTFSEVNRSEDFDVVYEPFDRWLKETHPEDFDARGRFGGWDTVAEAEQAGTLLGQHADEWAAYLVANGCTYRDSAC